MSDCYPDNWSADVDDHGHRSAVELDRPARPVDQGDRGAVVATFQMAGVGLPEEVVRGIRQSPMWPQLEQLAQSVVYDATITAELQRPTPAMQAVAIPALVLRGEPTWPFLATAAQGITERLPNAELRVVPGESVHGIDPTGTAAAIRRFEE